MPNFEQVFNDCGVDLRTNPPWMLVPLHWTNLVLLKGAPHAQLKTMGRSAGVVRIREIAGKDIHAVEDQLQRRVRQRGMKGRFGLLGVVNSRAGTFTERRIFEVRGLRKGETTIKAMAGGQEQARIDVSVKEPRTARVSFHFVQHIKHSTYSTRKQPADVESVVNTVNWILEPQTNTWIKKHFVSAPGVTFSRLVKSTDPVQVKSTMNDLAKMRDPDADINMFLVNMDIFWYTPSDGYHKVEKGASRDRDTGILVVKDSAGKEHVRSLAHELVHALAPSATHDLGKNIDGGVHIFTRAGQHNSTRIPKFYANLINP